MLDIWLFSIFETIFNLLRNDFGIVNLNKVDCKNFLSLYVIKDSRVFRKSFETCFTDVDFFKISYRYDFTFCSNSKRYS